MFGVGAQEFSPAVAVMIFVIAGPQFGSKLETVKKRGVEIMVCLDVSNSMMAEDIQPNRLEKAKQMLSRMTESFTNDKVGLIVFAGDAFTQLPITSDYISAKMFLSSISPSMVSTQGAAADRGISVNIVGIGQPEGAPIPVGGSSNYMKDNDGNVVITRLNEQMCQEIAAAGKGIYVRADNTNSALHTLQKEIDKMQKAEQESQVYSEYDEQFQSLAWIVLLLLIAEYIIMDRRNRIFRRVKLFSR